MSFYRCPLCNGPGEKVIWPAGHQKEDHPDKYQCSNDTCPLVDSFLIEDWKRFPRKNIEGSRVSCRVCAQNEDCPGFDECPWLALVDDNDKGYIGPGFPLMCSFCGSADSFVVVGPRVCICVECATQASKGDKCGVVDRK